MVPFQPASTITLNPRGAGIEVGRCAEHRTVESNLLGDPLNVLRAASLLWGQSLRSLSETVLV